jgi:zinc protease
MKTSLRSTTPRTLFLLLGLMNWALLPAEAQTVRSMGKEAVGSLEFGALDFEAPEVERRTLKGDIPVLFIQDHSLPLVTLYARFRGGFALLPRESYAAATALPGLIRSGGTRSMPPDSVDHLMDFYALQTSFGGGGQSSFSNLNTLTKHISPVLRLWGEILRNPRFDPVELEVWRGRQMESIRRRKDDPGGLAFAEFNRLMFGDHPIGWEMNQGDLAPERLSVRALEEVHGRIFCPENLILGVVGDVEWGELGPLLEEMVEGWPACGEPVQDPLEPVMREGPGVFLIPREVSQSTVVMAHPGGVSQNSGDDYFSSRIGNSILGSSGFTSRLVRKVRTEKGWAYSASSLWTTPAKYQGIVGAVTQTKSESTVAAIQLILDTMQEMKDEAPSKEEVDRAIAQIVNGFVFNFQYPSQIVARQMFYLARGLREDWLEEYVRGIQEVSPRDVHRVFQAHVRPEEMLILILGDPDAFDAPLETLGRVQIWEVDDGGDPVGPSGTDPSRQPREGRRSPR